MSAEDVAARARHALLKEFAPASVVVDRNGRFLSATGDVQAFIGVWQSDGAIAAGDPVHATMMAGVVRASRSGEAVTVVDTGAQGGERQSALRLQVRPLQRSAAEEPLFLVSFAEDTDNADDACSRRRGQAVTPDDALEQRLALELQVARRDMQDVVEEIERTHDRLRSSQVELSEISEELQDDSAQLAASREALQALADELGTVNLQLHHKAGELEAANENLDGLLASANIATLFLDGNLRIRRFTPAARHLLRLLDKDIGRSLGELPGRAGERDLEKDARQVLTTLAPVQRDVPGRDRRWFMRRITPFRAAGNRIDGVVVTFTDISMLKAASAKLRLRGEQQAAVAALGNAALAGENLQALFACAVREVSKKLGVDCAAIFRNRPRHDDLILLAGAGWRAGAEGNEKVPNDPAFEPGFALASGFPVIANLREEDRFRAPHLFLEHGLASSISVPIGAGETAWGVLAGYSRNKSDFSVDDAHFLQSVANVLWQAIRREAVEASLRDSEARTSAFLSSSAVVGWMKDEQGRYVYVDDAYEKIVGVSRQNYLNRRDEDLWAGDEWRRYVAQDRQVLESGEALETIEHAISPDGVDRHFLVTKFPFTDASGRRYVGGFGVDITQRAEAESSLRDSEARLAQLVTTATVGIAFAMADGRIAEANNALLDIFGIDRCRFEADGLRWSAAELPDGRQLSDLLRRLAATGESEAVELTAGDGTGSTIWVLASARRVDPDNGDYVAFLVDITAQKKAELQLFQSQQRMRLAARLAGFGTYYGSVEAGEFTCSSELKKMFGLRWRDEDTLPIAAMLDVVNPDDRKRVAGRFIDSLNPTGSGEFAETFRIAGGSRWLLMKGRTVFRGQRNERRPDRFAGVVIDVTQRHRAEEQLREARAAAEAANDAKSRFLANMSHEIRTPMTAILGFADILGQKLDDSEAQVCLRTINDSGSHLCDILDDILDLARVEMGKPGVNVTDCDIFAIFAEFRQLMKVRARDKNLRFDVEFEGDIPRTIRTDRKLLRQVLLNLAGNAIKFTEKGGVRIVVSCDAAGERLRVSVTDTGIGIASEDVERIFQPFEQIQHDVAKPLVGTGLGLTISKNAVKLLGGEISVTSEPGSGSTFSFSITTGSLDDSDWSSSGPRCLDEWVGRVPARDLPRIKGRVLVVDDQRDIRFLVGEFLTAAGADVVTACNGLEALSCWRQSLRGKRIDLILMDLRMPKLDGIAAAEKLHAEGCVCPLVALTAHAMEEDRERCLHAGFDEFIEKPMERRELVEKLAALLDANGQARETATRDARTRVLYVDDSEDACRAQEMLLRARGYEVRTATDGAQALAAVADFHPDFALLDYSLGDRVTGADVMRALREVPRLADCVFVCISGRQEHEVPWRSDGFQHFLRKPADSAAVDRLLRDGAGQ